MPTPVSGAISALDLRTEITRGAGALSMNDIRIRYGVSSGSISFGDLYKCEGMAITGSTTTDKFGTYYGWQAGIRGSVSPNESNGRVQFAAASFMFSYSGLGNTVNIGHNNTTNVGVGNSVTSGYKATEATRFVADGFNTTISGATSDGSTSFFNTNKVPPAAGQTWNCLIKF